MSISVSTLNDRWAQLNAPRPASAAQPLLPPSQNRWWEPTGAAAAAASGNSAALSDQTSLALLTASGGWGSGAEALKDAEQGYGTSALAAASAVESAQPGAVGGQPAGPPAWSNDITNTGTNPSTGIGSTGGWNPTYAERFEQQFAISAYTTGAPSGSSSEAKAPLASIEA